ncbi:MAG: hypothetical protein ABMB14_29530 [Myxococcota bacterium]
MRVRIGLAVVVAGLVAAWIVPGASEAPAPEVAPPVVVAPSPSGPVDPDAALLAETNPLTGHAYTAAQVERIRLLRQRFPDNRLLPTTDPAVRAERQALTEAQQRRETRIVAGVATPEEIAVFYEVQRAQVRDRIVLAEFVLMEPGWEPRIYEKYTRVRDFAVGQIDRIDQRESTSLALASR